LIPLSEESIEERSGNKIERHSQISSYIGKKKMVNDRITVIVNRYGRVYEIPLQLEAPP
jgi:serine protease Do